MYKSELHAARVKEVMIYRPSTSAQVYGVAYLCADAFNVFFTVINNIFRSHCVHECTLTVLQLFC